VRIWQDHLDWEEHPEWIMLELRKSLVVVDLADQEGVVVQEETDCQDRYGHLEFLTMAPNSALIAHEC